MTPCYHCGEVVTAGLNFRLNIHDETRDFCCQGCLSVAQMIMNQGLDSYYQYRTELADKPEAIEHGVLEMYDDPDILNSVSEVAIQPQQRVIQLNAPQIHCSACAWLIERQLSDLEGVESVLVNVSIKSIKICWNQQSIGLSQLLKRLWQLGYQAEPYQADKVLVQFEREQKSWFRRLGLAGLGMMQVMMYAVALYIGAFNDINPEYRDFLRWASFAIATPVLVYGGWPFHRNAWLALKNTRLSMDVPISLALWLAYLASLLAMYQQTSEVYFDSVTMFVFFLLVGRYLEFRTRQQVIDKLYRRAPDMPLWVSVINQDGSFSKKALTKIKCDETIEIGAGATVPLDGTLLESHASINQALMNGEFLPVDKKQGETVFAGSQTTDQPVRLKVSQLTNNSYWNKLLKLQQEALTSKPQQTKLADNVARYFVLTILLVALAVGGSWWLVDPSKAVWVVIAVLVVSCPCALSLATPVAETCAALSLNHRNILLKDTQVLSKLAHVTDIVFDKTGTLTAGALKVAAVHLQSSNCTEAQVLTIIAALERRSSHPIAKAFIAYDDPRLQVTSAIQHPYAGVEASVDGQHFIFGQPELINCFIDGASFQGDSDYLYLASEDKVIAQVLLEDPLRPQALQACQNLSDKTLHILSGDPSSAVSNLAHQLGIDCYRNAQRPEDKVAYVTNLQQQGKKVVVVGDGLNDAPVIGQADISIAMAAAADITKNGADVILQTENLTDINRLIDKARFSQGVIKQNLFWAFMYNLSMLPLAASGLLPPYLAAIGMSLSSIVVVVNALRLKR